MNIILLGFGKMGKAIFELAPKQNHSVISVVDNAAERDSIAAETLALADVVIEFTTPDTALENIRWAIANKLPIVVGTTGWYEHYETIKKEIEAAETAMISATNFSLGVNLFFAAASEVAKLFVNHLDDYKLGITEIHHTQKKDAPSGTAITLAETVINQIPSFTNWSLAKTPANNELPIESLRLPDVPGTHELYFSSEADSIVLTHTAHNRDGFALGAITAAQFLIGKTGVFTMKDVLGFK